MRNTMPIGLVAVAAMAALSGARVAEAERLRLTVADSFRHAKRHSFELKRQGAEYSAAVSRRNQARGAFFPRIELTGQVSRVQEVQPGTVDLSSDTGVMEATFGEAISSITVMRAQIVQPLFTGLRTRRTYEAARLGIDVAREQQREAELDLRLAVEQAYFGTYLAKELERVAVEAVDVVGAHLASIRKLHEAGRATDLDLAHAEAELADAEASREEARQQLAESQAVLMMLLGLPGGTEIELVEVPEEREATTGALTERALLNRPELRVARTSSKVERTQVGVARAGYYPTVSAQAGYTYANPNERFVPPEQAFHGTWDVGVVAAWSFDWGITRGRVDEARARALAAEYSVAALEDDTRTEATRVEATLVATARRITAARAAADAAARAFTAAERMFELGRLESTVLLDRELDLRRARARLLQALVDHRLAGARARRLIGAGS